MKDTFYRPVTHHGYKTKKIEEGLKNSFHHVPKAILRSEVLHVQSENVGKNKEFYYVNNNCMSLKTASKVVPIWGGGLAFSLRYFFYIIM